MNSFVRYPPLVPWPDALNEHEGAVVGDDEEDDFGEGECTCHRTGLGGNDPDAGWRLDRWCPVHGQDPDDARDERDERKRERDEG